MASYTFYAWWDYRFLALIFISTFIDFTIGHLLEKTVEKKRKALLWFSITTNLGILFLFKYFNFFIESLTICLETAGIKLNTTSLEIILPVGISFYTFQTLSYTIDVYKRKIDSEKSFIVFAAFVSFFPQLVAGPIERASNLLPQFHSPRIFTYRRGSQALKLILWGLFKKVVVADNCAVFSDIAFSEFNTLSSLELIFGAIFFSVQIYGDFSGYSDIARGSAKLLGFDLMENFKAPYFSTTINEFWNKWHISLSSWFRDYVYIPLGGNRINPNRTVVNIFIVFLISGIWHGAGWNFIVWGALHGILLVTYNYFSKSMLSTVRIHKSISMFFVFMLVTTTWIFFRAENLGHAFIYLDAILSNQFFPVDNKLLKIYMALILCVGFVLEYHFGRVGNVFALNKSTPIVYKFSLYYLIVFMILLFGRFNETPFIYFQF
ncbi:MAG: MBOAT family O-acyltransferase [Cytophagaceae bacterium]